MLPAHNHALRRKAESGVLALPAVAGAAGIRSARQASNRRSSPASSGRFASKRQRARGAALARVRARALLEGAGARKATGAVLRAAGEALRRRMRRRRIRRSASRAPSPRAGAHAHSALAICRARGHSRAVAARRSHRRARDPRLVLARDRARRWRARPAHRGAAAPGRSMPTSARLLIRTLARGKHEVLLARARARAASVVEEFDSVRRASAAACAARTARDARGQLRRVRNVQELVRAVRVRFGTEHAGDQELGVPESACPASP